jgi:hypothetical protein
LQALLQEISPKAVGLPIDVKRELLRRAELFGFELSHDSCDSSCLVAKTGWALSQEAESYMFSMIEHKEAKKPSLSFISLLLCVKSTRESSQEGNITGINHSQCQP